MNVPRHTPLVEVEHLVKEFRSGAPWPGRTSTVRAVDDVTFTVNAGEILGLVGESGSGKTTLARCLVRVVEPTSGTIRFRGEDVTRCSRARLREIRRDIQMVFQDPATALNPRMRIGDIIAEPLVAHGWGRRHDRRQRVAELLQLVGLDPTEARRFPRELSGGQRQRVGLARALALRPSLVIADEPVSALDVSVQAQVMSLFVDLHERFGLTSLFIAHDLRLVGQVCARVAVMWRGRLVELAPAVAVLEDPRHPYTKALVSAMPSLDPTRRAARLTLDPTAVDHTAPLREVGPGHLAAV